MARLDSTVEKIYFRKNFLWNFIGSGIYALSSMLLSIVVIRIMGAEEGGVFSIALTLSQILLYIAYFETRNFQITDSNDEFVFEEYHTAKIVLCILMIIICIGYVVLQRYDINKTLVVLLVCSIRCFDGYADVYEAQFQKEGELHLAGKSLTFRTIIFMISLFITLLLTKELIFSLIISNACVIGAVWLFDIRVMKKRGIIRFSTNWEKIGKIVKSCFPLFIGMFCWSYILSASRIAIDGNMDSKYQAYFQILFLPVSVINLFASFVFRPILPTLSLQYHTKRYREFFMFALKGIVLICITTIVCMIGAYMIGIPILSLVSGCDLSNYTNVLVLLLLAGGFNAISFTMYYLLTIMRCTRSILIDYIIAAIVAFLISGPLVRVAGIKGATWSYFIVVVGLCIIFAFSILRKVRIDILKSEGH